MLEVGQPAPPFSLQSDTDETVSLDDLKGRPVVVYFYPKDDTPGCTRQACSIRDSWAEFGRIGANVIGVSPQSPESHRKFKAKYGLPFPLLADTDRAALDAYGFWGERPNGSVGVIRSTVLIGADGTIEHVWSPVDPDEHLEIIREALAA